MNATSAAGRAMGIAHQMQMGAAAEGNPHHVQHVLDQIAYTDAVAQAYYDAVMNYINTQLPKMIDAEILKMQQQQKVQVELDEKSVQQVRTKISNLIKSLFQ